MSYMQIKDVKYILHLHSHTNTFCRYFHIFFTSNGVMVYNNKLVLMAPFRNSFFLLLLSRSLLSFPTSFRRSTVFLRFLMITVTGAVNTVRIRSSTVHAAGGCLGMRANIMVAKGKDTLNAHLRWHWRSKPSVDAAPGAPRIRR